MKEIVISNARIVTPTECFIGSCSIEDGIITDVAHKNYKSCDFDLNENWLLPGCIDIHTDQLELEINPRPKTQFSLSSAIHALDTRAISNGITTVLSCLRFSKDTDKHNWMIDNIEEKSLQFEELCDHTMARHFIQARWDTNFSDTAHLLEHIRSLKLLRLLVYNENIPGARQFRDLDSLILSFSVRHNLSLEEGRRTIEEKIARNSKIDNRQDVCSSLNGRIIIGSHDDTTTEHIHQAHHYGSTLAEMPTTMEAARTAKAYDMWVCMSAANYMRGGSTYGNLATADAIAENTVDMLCSDFHFPAFLASFVKMLQNDHISPSRAADYLSLNAARCLGMDDRIGSIEAGKSADLVAFRIESDFAKVKHVWVDGVTRCSYPAC
jgi:alpha-D-ribose 1-methylphosphonate 5-triphosphate diphosphatase